MKARPRQLSFDSISVDWTWQTIPANLVVIGTQDGDIDRIVKEMLKVPMEKSIILDFWVGHKAGTHAELDEDHAELLRLQYMLNYRTRGQRFDFLGNSLLNKAIRVSIQERRWDVGDHK